MRKFLFVICAIFAVDVAHAATETLNWYVDGETYATTTCQIGGDIILPNTPTKYGYTFQGWLSYTPLEYLESTGTQWIDTGIAPSGVTIGFETEFALTTVASDRWIFGYDIVEFGVYSSLQVYYPSTYISFGNPDTNWHTIKFNSPHGGTRYDNQILYDYRSNLVATSRNYTMDLFARNYQGRIGNNATAVKIKYFKLYMGDILVRDFIPVLDQGGTPCMFDKVSKTFFYNAGTGNFIAGPVLTE